MINNIQLYAERHTGSKWLEELIKESFGFGYLFDFGFKHWFPEWDKINNTNTENYLFVVLSRNPYQWVKSMHEAPHHVADELRRLSLDEFISKEWYCVWRKREVKYMNGNEENDEMLYDRNPDTNERMKNIIELRNYKNREFLKLKNIVENIIYIRYENLFINPQEVIELLSDNFNIKKVKDVNLNKKNKQEKELTPFSIDFINQNINWEYEIELGYKKD